MSVSSRIKDAFVAGLILIAPLVITLYVLTILVNWSLQFINPIVAETRLVEYTANIELVAQVIAVSLIVAAITILGLMAQWSIGKHLFGNVGRTVNFIPLVSTIYRSVRQVATSLVDRDTGYESVVLVEYPREGLYSIGLVTSEGRRAIDDVTGEQAYSVFLPNSPNPTAGRLVMVPGSQIHETEMSVREGMRLIVTTGIGDDDESALDAYDLPAGEAGSEHEGVPGDE